SCTARTGRWRRWRSTARSSSRSCPRRTGRRCSRTTPGRYSGWSERAGPGYDGDMESQMTPVETRPVPVIAEHIEITPGVCGGKPSIAEHRITVQNIALWHECGGLSPQQIVAAHPGITLADVYAALAYYHDHRDEIRAQIQADEEFADRLKASSLSPLQEK